ncbi:phospholipase A [Coxiella burnetii]|uniref:phospholipase A n=1 Tax=Coxiella burnetii TaxID=777 RepID=UPI000CCC1CA5|nr:phospholipase A [Coxiella burnetii]PNT89540.1 phospholipase [Coxiella burnetii]
MGKAIRKVGLFVIGILVILPFQSGAHTHTKTTSQLKNSRNDCRHIKRYDKKTKHYYNVVVCKHATPPPPSFEEKLQEILSNLTPAQQSLLEKRLARQRQVTKTRAGISFYEPTYILPYYYTGRPYHSIYEGNTPENQQLDHQEFKGQMSFQFPIWYDMFGSNLSLDISYTQLSYWQFYAKSQFFRETNYEPQLFLSDHFSPNGLAAIGINHQSNGRGGNLERSWNRLFLDFTFTGVHWMVDVKPWILIFKAESSDLHNPDIYRYLGYGRVVFAVTFHRQVLSLMLRNTVESGFKRGAIELSYSFPIHGLLHGYIQFFSGYGQSLIEYNHYTNSVGVGIIISNWI